MGFTFARRDECIGDRISSFTSLFFMLGTKLERDQGVITSIATPTYNPAHRGPLVSDVNGAKFLSPNRTNSFILFTVFLDVFSDEPTGRLALVFELMEMNLYEAIKGRTTYLPESRVKFYIYQLLKAIEHMHRNGIFHRDIKP